MKKITLLLAAAALMLGTGASAQGFTLGAKAGLNVSNVWGKGAAGTKAKTGFNVGVLAEYGFNERCYAGYGIEYSLKGYKVRNSGNARANMSYLNIPFYGGYKFPIGSRVSIYGQFGPYFAFAVGGKGTYTYDSGNGSVTVKSKLFGKNRPYKVFDFGFGFGTGVQFGRWLAGLNYELGVINISQASGRGNVVRNSNFSINTGYKF